MEKNKPVLQFSVLCDGVASPDTKAVFIGVFSSFIRPGNMAPFFVVNRWIYGKGDFRQKVAIKTPDLKHVIHEAPERKFSLKEEFGAHNIVNGFVNVNFEKPGVYWVEVSLDDEVVMSYPLPVYDLQQ